MAGLWLTGGTHRERGSREWHADLLSPKEGLIHWKKTLKRQLIGCNTTGKTDTYRFCQCHIVRTLDSTSLQTVIKPCRPVKPQRRLSALEEDLTLKTQLIRCNTEAKPKLLGSAGQWANSWLPVHRQSIDCRLMYWPMHLPTCCLDWMCYLISKYCYQTLQYKSSAHYLVLIACHVSSITIFQQLLAYQS